MDGRDIRLQGLWDQEVKGLGGPRLNRLLAQGSFQNYDPLQALQGLQSLGADPYTILRMLQQGSQMSQNQAGGSQDIVMQLIQQILQQGKLR
jgi:hypothetical protein